MPESAIAEMHFDVGYLDQFVLDNSSYTTLRCKELATICDPRVRQWFEEQGIERITFGDLKIKPLLSLLKATVLYEITSSQLKSHLKLRDTNRKL